MEAYPNWTGIWKGLPCAVIGGGSSLRGFDFDRLHGIRTIGVNAALKVHPTIWYGADPRCIEFLMKSPAWHGAWPFKLVPEFLQKRKNYPWCSSLPVAPHNVRWGTSMEEGVASMDNSGITALNLADILGADPIVLLGFDAYPGSKEEPLQHWHDDYPPEYKSRASASVCFVASFKEHGIFVRAKVFNACPDSGIHTFPRVSLEKGLELLSCPTI